MPKSRNLSELDIGEDWVDSEDESELGDYASEQLPAEIVNKTAERKLSQVVRIVPDQRKSSTGSNVTKHKKFMLAVCFIILILYRLQRIRWMMQKPSNQWISTWIHSKVC